MKVRLGPRWYEYIDREYKLRGVFLWCDSRGSFTIERPESPA